MNPASTPTRTLTGFFAGTVGRPVALAVAFVTLLVLGAIAYSRIPIQLLPSDLTPPQMNIWISNPDSNARENEEQVARPIEEQLRTLAGIETVFSQSNDGYVLLGIRFDPQIDMDLARAEVRDRLERAWPSLPDTVMPASIWSHSASSMPISFLGITVDGDPERRDYLVEKVVRPRLEAVQGIGKIDIWGVLEDSVRILLDEDEVIAAGLDVGGVIRRISADNFATPMGEVRDGGREFLLRSDMRFTSEQEIADFPIGNGLTLKDVGRVAKVKSVGNELTLIDGDYAYFGIATKDSQSNVVETCRNLREMTEAIEKDPASGGDVRITPFFMQGDFIESALGQLQQTALWGGLLAVGVLFVFLRRVRLTLCVALSIPVSALLAITWNYFSGASFNLLSMAGITLGIGMLVDNSVVVVENIVRIHQRGEDRLTAAALGVRQIALAVTLATLTTVAVFVPLIFMSDDPMSRVMLGAMGIPLAISLLASLFVAVVFLPVITARTMTSDDPGKTSRVGRLFETCSRVPVRATALLVGLARWTWYGLLRALHRLNRIALAVLRYGIWLLVPAALAFAVLVAGSFAGVLAPGKVLEEFGIRLGPPAEALGTVPLVMAVLAIALALFARLYLLRTRPARPPERPEHFVPRGTSLIDMIVSGNQGLVAWTLKHRVLASVLAFVACLSPVVPYVVPMPFEPLSFGAFGQEEADDDASFRVVFDTEFTLAEAEEQVAIYEDYLARHQDELGYEHRICNFSERGAEFEMFFAERRPRTEVRRIEEQLETELPRVSGHRLVFYKEDESEGKTISVARFTLVGPDSRELERLGALAVDVLQTVRGLSQVTSPLENAPEMIEVSVDRERALGLGVNTEAIQNSIAWTLGGWSLPRYQEEGREVPLIIEYDKEKTAGLSSLRDLGVFAQAGSVPLESVAELGFKRGARTIVRRNGQTSFTLQAKVDDPLQILAVTDSAHAALDTIELPRGFSWDRTESVRAQNFESLFEMLRALLLAAVLVFLLMAILFESFILPFSVFATVPFAFLGAFWTLTLTGTRLDVIGIIGLLILVGVVVNNGIVLVDRIHGLRRRLPRAESVLDGCAHRVRPILMTALTTVTGLLPMAITEPPPQSIVDYRALATVVAGGLLCSTFFTLWVVPLAYTILDDVWKVLMTWAGWWGRTARSAAPVRGSGAGSPPIAGVAGTGDSQG